MAVGLFRELEYIGWVDLTERDSIYVAIVHAGCRLSTHAHARNPSPCSGSPWFPVGVLFVFGTSLSRGRWGLHLLVPLASYYLSYFKDGETEAG